MKTRMVSQTLSGGCPVISVGSMNFAGGATPTVGIAITGGALITGGAAGYTLTGTTGTVPTGLTCSVAENAGSWYVVLSGTPTTFGSYTFTANGEDSNGCPFGKSFTILVWGVFDIASVQSIPVGGGVSGVVTVSGIGNNLGVNAILDHVEISTSTASNDQLYIEIYEPSLIGSVVLITSGGYVTGTNITNCNIYSSGTGNPALNTGSAPYTGNWDGFQSYMDLDGYNPNGDWEIFSSIDTPGNTITELKLYFKPN